MKQFIAKTLIFLTLVAVSFVLVLYQADGYTDAFYMRFTTPPQSNLILGSSRAAQGIRPKVLEAIIEDKDFFNYSFTISQSPYGPIYYESIKKKLDKQTNDAVFVLEVNPWSICSNIEAPNDSTKFREVGQILATTSNVNTKPNFGYLYHNLGGNYYKILFRINPKMFLHDNGWLEISVAMDSSSVKKRTQRKVKSYKTNASKAKFSTLRLAYLIKTIEYLKGYGKVFLVRLPISKEILAIENELMPEFEQKIGKAIDSSDGYLDLTIQHKQFRYTDGNHLYKESGTLVSKELAKWIKSQ